MRGAKALDEHPESGADASEPEPDEALALLHEIRDELRALRDRSERSEESPS